MSYNQPQPGYQTGAAPQYPGAVPQVGFGPPTGQQPGYPPQQPGYPPQQPGYPPQQPGYPSQQPGYPPQQLGYSGSPPATQGVPPPQAFPPQNAPPLQTAAPPGKPTWDVPNEDVDENPNAAAPAPSAPPADMFSHFSGFSGYENTSFGQPFLPPPPPYQPPEAPPHPEQVFKQATSITEDQARSALLNFVGEHCCYGKGAARDMEFTGIQPSSAYHYSLTSFCEGRQTAYRYEPYRGQPIDGPNNGQPPPPWTIPAQPAKMFQNSEVKIEVPHTAVVKPCHDCMAMGYKRCYHCHGRGRVRCTSCHGSGHRSVYRDGEHHREHCTWCHGSGRRNCTTCHGDGRVKCWTCQGQGNLKTFIELTVNWRNHVDNHVVERTALPDELIVDSQGTEIFSQELPRVWPISAFHDADVNEGSKRLVQQHGTQFNTERLLMQRQLLRAVPVSEVHYRYKETTSRFWVYGHDHKVYAPDYPQQCCCGCVLL